MLDIKYINNNQAEIKKSIKLKKLDLDLDLLLNIDKQRRELITKIEILNQQRKKLAAVAQPLPTAKQIAEGKRLKNELSRLLVEQKHTNKLFMDLMVKVPVSPSQDTPFGQSEADNVEVLRKGKMPEFTFKPKDHMELAKSLDVIDFARGVKTSGYRGYYLKNEVALLQLALMLYALAKVNNKGYIPFIPPTIVREFALFGTGYFSGQKYDEQVDEIYKIANRDKDEKGNFKSEEKFLIGTAEPSLLAYYANEILEEKDLPIRLSGFSQCYRSEIGSYGRDTQGLYRVHEFMKVELVTICPADISFSNKLQDDMIKISEELHEDLKLPYRKVQICTADLTAGKHRQFDLEVWLPGRNTYGESGSASNFLDWQARRLNIQYRTADGKKEYAFLLNNTALPTPRILMAILENYQQKNGEVIVPQVLQPITGFKKIKIKK